MTDIKFLIVALTKTTTTTEKRFMIVSQSVWDAYDSFESNYVALIRFEFSNADALTKMKTIFILLDTTKSGRIDHGIVQWIILPEWTESSFRK